jgi:HlyD family secretion protein
MKRIAIIISAIALLALIVFLFLGNQSVSGALQQQGQKRAQPSASPAATRAPTGAPVISRNDQVAAACKLVPISYVNLSFNTPGLVAEVLVTEGEKVAQGQLLAHLSNQEEAQAAIASANLDLINAQQTLKTLYDEAPLKAAEALLALATAPENVQNAEGKISGLETRFYNQAEVDAAKANLIFAQNKLENAQDAYRPYANKNENSLMKAKLLSDLSQAQKDYDAALRKYNSFFTAPSETTVSKAEADLSLARVQEEDAQRRYEILKNGPDPDEVALAQARISNAEAQLAAAQSSLANMELRAPFTGTVATLDLKPGAYVSPGADVLLLVDDSDWRVETTDLTELNVVRIREGNTANITFDALPDIKFEGNVLKINSIGENRQGDITYRVETNLKGFDKRLKWNMTCSITIQTR